MYVPALSPLVALLMTLLATLLGQATPDFTGHWEGSTQIPEMTLSFAIDLAKNASGELTGTLDLPGENITGLPLTKVAVDGNTITFHARADQPLTGVIADDGKSITGTHTISGSSIPFVLTRTGDARREAPPRIASIAEKFEGTWNGTLEAGALKLRLVLTMSNQPDGTAAAKIVNLDQGGLVIPASAITQTATGLTLDFKSINGSYAAALNPDGTELAGTFTQAKGSLPMTFRKTAPTAK